MDLLISKYKLLLIILSSLLIAENKVKGSTKRDKPQLLMISFDGFKYDYLDAFQPPNFLKFAKTGVRAKLGMKPAFPSKTFPNHYTLATGLYPESHGIVDNAFYDDVFKENFTSKMKETKWFDAGEPIWITGRLQGLTTAAYFWFGSETTIKNVTANYFVNYDKTVPWTRRIDTVVDWLANKDVSFVALYFEEPDGAGHRNGSYSEGVRQQVKKVDDTLGNLVQKLEEKKVMQNLNVILLSDHGMANVSHVPSENLVLEKFMKDNEIMMVTQIGPIAAIYPRGKATDLRDKLNQMTPNVKVYLKEEVPSEFHYRNNRRIAPLVAIAEEGYQTVGTSEDSLLSIMGNHGYNNSLPSMWPFFMAAGPSFKKDFVFEDQFENVNIYPLLCHLLGLKPSPNNGSLDNVRFLLNSGTKFVGNTSLFLLCLLFPYLKYVLIEK